MPRPPWRALAAPGPASALLAVAGRPARPGGLFLSTTHLGKPWRFYRGFNNLRWSPVSREGLATVVFLFFAAVQGALWLPGHPWAAALGLALPAPSWLAGARAALAVLTALAGLAALYYMYRCYRIKARPFWDTPQTATAFLGNALALGALAAGAVAWAAAGWGPWLGPLAALLALGLAVEGLGLWWHARHLNTAGHEGSASHYIQCTTFGKTYLARNLLLGANTAAAAALAWIGPAAWPLGLFLAVTVPLAALVGRALFYVLVVPTTLPGAFFWRNKAFEQHARDIGLAANPAVGVPLHDH
ncbi:MAG: hypothetical protein KatS3mg121_0897 [Gammaproteobacteria bacterium]|nr:MAG: hypothetical protein KatS3mg121_0897 [Gammaproteobacteria bacterium]